MKTKKTAALTSLPTQKVERREERMGVLRHEDYQSRQIVSENYHKIIIPTPLNPLEGATGSSNIKEPLLTPQTEKTYCLTNSTFFDCFDAVLLFSCFRGVPITDGDRSRYFGSTQKRLRVSVKVEATVVNEDKDAVYTTNEEFKASQWRKQFDLDTKLAESTFVGIVEDFELKNQQKPLTSATTPTGDIWKGTLVTSIRKCATKARIVSMQAEELISLSQFQDLDSGEVAALVSSYLPAFGALYHGIDLKFRDSRFTTGSLSNCQVLVSGGRAVDSEAVIKLALLGGASRVFAYQVSNLGKIKHPKLVVLDGPAENYASRLYQSIDVIVDWGFPKHVDFLKQAVAPTGRLVCVVPRNPSNSLQSRVAAMLDQATLIKHKRTTIYDFEDMCKTNYGQVLRDLQYLLDLTQKRRLRPRVDRYIKSRDVEIMQEDMAIRPPRGAVICEPWREFIQEPQRQNCFQERLEEFCTQTLQIKG